MYNHEPENYLCPFCVVARGEEHEKVSSKQSDVFYRDELVTAIVATHQLPANLGQTIIVPNQHIENLYDMPDDVLAKVHQHSKRVAIAMKKIFNCDGIHIRNHNEMPGQGQDVLHYHLHIMPRFWDDKMMHYEEVRELISQEKRAEWAGQLRDAME